MPASQNATTPFYFPDEVKFGAATGAFYNSKVSANLSAGAGKTARDANNTNLTSEASTTTNTVTPQPGS